MKIRVVPYKNTARGWHVEAADEGSDNFQVLQDKLTEDGAKALAATLEQRGGKVADAKKRIEEASARLNRRNSGGGGDRAASSSTHAPAPSRAGVATSARGRA